MPLQVEGLTLTGQGKGPASCRSTTDVIATTLSKSLVTSVHSPLIKRDNLVSFVLDQYPAVIALTGTWLSSAVVDSEISRLGYTVSRCDRVSTWLGGGVVLFVRDRAFVILLQSPADPEGLYESLRCKLKLSGNCPKTVDVCYRSPAAALQAILDEPWLWECEGHYLVLGGFNPPNISWVSGRCLFGDELFSRDLLNTADDLCCPNTFVNLPEFLLRSRSFWTSFCPWRCRMLSILTILHPLVLVITPHTWFIGITECCHLHNHIVDPISGKRTF